MAVRRTSCGVVVTDGMRLLLGHATGSPRWDIPKGLAEPGESFRDAAARELFEETGLSIKPQSLVDIGVFGYLPGKDLALFARYSLPLPEPASLHCASCFTNRQGALVPEFDRFGLFAWDAAWERVGKNIARVLRNLRPQLESIADA